MKLFVYFSALWTYTLAQDCFAAIDDGTGTVAISIPDPSTNFELPCANGFYSSSTLSCSAGVTSGNGTCIACSTVATKAECLTLVDQCGGLFSPTRGCIASCAPIATVDSFIDYYNKNKLRGEVEANRDNWNSPNSVSNDNVVVNTVINENIYRNFFENNATNVGVLTEFEEDNECKECNQRMDGESCYFNSRSCGFAQGFYLEFLSSCLSMCGDNLAAIISNEDVTASIGRFTCQGCNDPELKGFYNCETEHSLICNTDFACLVCLPGYEEEVLSCIDENACTEYGGNCTAQGDVNATCMDLPPDSVNEFSCECSDPEYFFNEATRQCEDTCGGDAEKENCFACDTSTTECLSCDFGFSRVDNQCQNVCPQLENCQETVCLGPNFDQPSCNSCNVGTYKQEVGIITTCEVCTDSSNCKTGTFCTGAESSDVTQCETCKETFFNASGFCESSCEPDCLLCDNATFCRQCNKASFTTLPYYTDINFEPFGDESADVRTRVRIEQSDGQVFCLKGCPDRTYAYCNGTGGSAGCGNVTGGISHFCDECFQTCKNCTSNNGFIGSRSCESCVNDTLTLTGAGQCEVLDQSVPLIEQPWFIPAVAGVCACIFYGVVLAFLVALWKHRDYEKFEERENILAIEELGNVDNTLVLYADEEFDESSVPDNIGLTEKGGSNAQLLDDDGDNYAVASNFD